MTGAQEEARAVWYYYVGGLTQQAIAERLGMTRLRVNRIVGQARLDGSVRIDVAVPLASCVRLEEALAARWGLQAVTVIPSLPDLDALQLAVGAAAGEMLDPLLDTGREPGSGWGLGVGWGRTLRATAGRLTPHRLEGASVTSLMGGLIQGTGTNTFEVATEFARTLGAECYYFVAPIHCPSAESRAALLGHNGLAQVMRRAREAAVAVVSCGDLTPRSLLAATRTVAENMESLKAAGAVGDLLGVYLDAAGQPVDHPLNACVMALSPQELRACPVSILASGGLNKLAVIRAILTAGYVTRLVTDEDVAEALL